MGTVPFNNKLNVWARGSSGAGCYSEVPLALNVWQHVAFSVGVSNGVFDGRVYLNGDRQTAGGCEGVSRDAFVWDGGDFTPRWLYPPVAGQINIGNDYSGGEASHAAMSDLRVYSRTLSRADVQAAMTGPPPTPRWGACANAGAACTLDADCYGAGVCRGGHCCSFGAAAAGCTQCTPYGGSCQCVSCAPRF